MFQRRRKDQRFPILVKSYHPPTEAAGIQPFFTYERDPAGMEVFSGWNQLMVNWCFGLAVWIPRIPLCFRDCYLGVPREIPNHQPKPPSTDTNLFVSEKKHPVWLEDGWFKWNVLLGWSLFSWHVIYILVPCLNVFFKSYNGVVASVSRCQTEPPKLKRVKLNHFLKTYCWWTKSCTTKDDDYSIIYKVLYIPGGGARFCPSTVSLKPPP